MRPLLEIFFAPMEEQTSIAATVSNMDVATAAMQACVVKARQLRQGMLPELLTSAIRLALPQKTRVTPGQ